MKSTLKTKLDQLLERYEELGALMSDSDVISDQNMFRAYSREYAEIEPVVLCYRDYERQLNELEETKILAGDEDEDIRAMAAEELDDLQSRVDGLDQALQKLLLPRDPNDSHNVFLEIRAGTGGDEAAIFAGDLFKMYQRFAETRNWKVEIMNERAGDHGGFKEIISRIAGKEVFGQLKFESGAHRVQRVPQTESQARAMSLLQAKLMDQAEQKQSDEQAAARRSLVGSGDRSEKIRTYNFPDSRVTDHRINLTLHRLAQTMAGDMAPIIDHLVQEHQADLLGSLGDELGD